MRRILTAILAIISIQAYSQVSVSDSLSTERFQVRNGAIRGTYPKASAYVDVNTSGLVAIRQLGSDRIIVNYQAANSYVINGANTATLDSAVSWLGDVIGLEYCCAGSSSTDTIILDGNTFLVQGQNSAIQVDNSILVEGDTISFTGISTTENDLDILIGVASGILPESVALAQVSNDSGSVNILGSVDAVVPAISIGVVAGSIDYLMAFEKTGVIIAGDLPDIPFSIDNGTNSTLFYKNGAISQSAAYCNIAYVVDDTPGGFTIPDNKYLAVYDPASLQANATITFPTNPIDGQIQVIAFGGAITSGTVVTTLTLATSGGQTINVGTAASTGTVEQPLTFQYLQPLNKWYLISK